MARVKEPLKKLSLKQDDAEIAKIRKYIKHFHDKHPRFLATLEEKRMLKE